jgi:hypothetical protein
MFNLVPPFDGSWQNLRLSIVEPSELFLFFNPFPHNANCQVKQTRFWDANFHPDRYTLETPYSHLRNAKFHHRIYKRPILDIKASRSVTKSSCGPSTSVYKQDLSTCLFYSLGFSLLETVTVACYFIFFCRYQPSATCFTALLLSG